MPNKYQLVWFRSDLRKTDNKALFYASKQGPVLAVYLSYPEQWISHGEGENKLWFFYENLISLQGQLSTLNIPLICVNADRFSESAKVLIDLAVQYQCECFWFNDEYGVNEQKRDDQVYHAFINRGFNCNRFTDQLLFTPGSILTGKGEFYKVFTPFKKALYRNILPDVVTPLPAPLKQPSIPVFKHIKQKLNNPYSVTSDIKSLWPAGEKTALNRLKEFLDEKSGIYHMDRDYPAISGTSLLSAWLNCGSISIRQCFYSAFISNYTELDTGNAGLCCWLSELVWREFYRHILVGFPRISKGSAFNEATEKLPWQNKKDLLKAWQSGKTGYPIVDAAMRQLVKTGWMHNRLRMVTAMFLSKNLMVDWRLGEKFFMKHLIDGDLASNNGGWQWAASTGTDAAPYFRMFNPVSQSRKFDPKGLFIRKWLPELESLDNKQIHEPYGKGGDLFAPEIDYPRPIVDHSTSRAKVLAAFKQLK